MSKKTGIELIAEERREQIEKHGWSLDHDQQYKNKELRQAASYCLMLADFRVYAGKNIDWPKGWNTEFEHKIIAKDKIGKLIVAGAFLMAENDRRGDRFHEDEVIKIAAEIDRLQQ